MIELNSVAEFVQECFTAASLAELMGTANTEAQRRGYEWLLIDGKRWRPLLTASVFAALGGNLKRIRPAVVAVECFHKASLVHDDIQDGDVERYGTPTVHALIGVPAAINVGDYLIGEGYRLLAHSHFDATRRAEMLLVAANGHRELCLGQGEELVFSRTPQALDEASALRIYQQKTAAAFEVSVMTGAVAAGVDAETRQALVRFSQSAGIAYQIRDDLADFHSSGAHQSDMLAMRPTLFLAAACVSDDAQVQAALHAVLAGRTADREELMRAIANAQLHGRVRELFGNYQSAAESALTDIKQTALQQLLHNIMQRMLH